MSPQQDFFTFVFEDASTTNEGSTAAFYVPAYHVSKSYRFSHQTPSTTAELLGLLQAARFISEGDYIPIDG